MRDITKSFKKIIRKEGKEKANLLLESMKPMLSAKVYYNLLNLLNTGTSKIFENNCKIF